MPLTSSIDSDWLMKTTQLFVGGEARPILLACMKLYRVVYAMLVGVFGHVEGAVCCAESLGSPGASQDPQWKMLLAASGWFLTSFFFSEGLVQLPTRSDHY